MEAPKTAAEKLEYLSRYSWLVVNKEDDDKEKLELVESGFSALVLPKICYSIDEAYRIQTNLEKTSDSQT